MIKLVKPAIQFKEKYIDMIKEYKENKEIVAPCIVEYDCNNPIETLDYDSMLDVVNSYERGSVFEYDKENFESSCFRFIINDNEDLLGVCEIRKGLKEQGTLTKGHLSIGIRPSERNKGYGFKATKEAVNVVKSHGVTNIIIIIDESNAPMKKILNRLGFFKRKNASSYILNIQKEKDIER